MEPMISPPATSVRPAVFRSKQPRSSCPERSARADPATAAAAGEAEATVKEAEPAARRARVDEERSAERAAKMGRCFRRATTAEMAVRGVLAADLRAASADLVE